MIEDVPMIAVPDTYRAKPKKDSDPNIISWGKVGAKRETCGLCTLDIRDGLLDRPMGTATKRATKGERRWFLCTSHTYEVKRGARRLP